MLTIVLLILIGVNISLLSNKLLAPVYANNKVKKEYEEIIAKRNEEIKKPGNTLNVSGRDCR